MAAELHLARVEQAAGGVALGMICLETFLPNEVGEVSAKAPVKALKRTEGSCVVVEGHDPSGPSGHLPSKLGRTG
jgi:hypothetical protein